MNIPLLPFWKYQQHSNLKINNTKKKGIVPTYRLYLVSGMKYILLRKYFLWMKYTTTRDIVLSPSTHYLKKKESFNTSKGPKKKNHKVYKKILPWLFLGLHDQSGRLC